MKCAQHGQEATGICVYCGQALCPECSPVTSSSRRLCSAACAEAVLRGERVLELLLQKSVQSLRASALYCYLCAALSLLAAGLAWFVLPLPFLIYFCAGCGVVLLISGFWYTRAAKKQLLT